MNENTNDNVKTLRCKPLDPNNPTILSCEIIPNPVPTNKGRDPEHPNERRCTSVPGSVVPTADSSGSTPSADTPAIKSGEGGSGTPTSEKIEVWNRSNGEALRVKRIECNGTVVYLPIATAPQPQTVDHQSPQVKTVKQNPTVGRTQISPCGSGSKRSCSLPSSRRLARAKQDDQAAKGP